MQYLRQGKIIYKLEFRLHFNITYIVEGPWHALYADKYRKIFQNQQNNGPGCCTNSALYTAKFLFLAWRHLKLENSLSLSLSTLCLTFSLSISISFSLSLTILGIDDK